MSGAGGQTGEFVFLEQINQLAYSKTYKGKHRSTNIHVFVKDFELQDDPEEKRRSTELLYQDLNILKEANSNFVIRFLDVEERNKHVYIIHEGVENSTICDLITKCREIPEKEQQRIIAQLVAGLEYLHQGLRICHRNISCKTVYLDTYYNIRYSNFSHAVRLMTMDQQMTGVCGAPEFCPLEMIRGGSYRRSIDVWSLGILIYYLVEGKEPFKGIDDYETYTQIESKQPKFSRRLSKDLIDLLTKMLDKDPSSRIPSEQLRHHAYFSGVDFDALTRPPIHISDADIASFLSEKGATATPVSCSVVRSYLLTESMREFGSQVPYVEHQMSIPRAVSMGFERGSTESNWRRRTIACGMARGRGKITSRKSGNWTDVSSDLSSDSLLMAKSDGNF